MEVPCPVPLAKPWSPVGYQVVELTDRNAPEGTQPPQVILAEPVAKNAIPRSPVGYRVVTVADEVVPAPKRWRDPDIRLRMRQRPRSSPWAIWVPLAVVAVVLAIPAFSLAIILSQARAPQQPRVFAAVVPEAIVVVPEGIRANAPADQKIDEPAPAKIAAPAPAAPPREVIDAAAADPFDLANQAQLPRPGREVFDTAVEFVRNPQEAARLAKQENKLTFILHLSGNFEDPGFT